MINVNVTITTLKTDLARILEPRAPRPDLRLDAVRQLNQAGVHAGVICAPVVPGITDSPRDLEDLEIRRGGRRLVRGAPEDVGVAGCDVDRMRPDVDAR